MLDLLGLWDIRLARCLLSFLGSCAPPSDNYILQEQADKKDENLDQPLNGRFLSVNGSCTIRRRFYYRSPMQVLFLSCRCAKIFGQPRSPFLPLYHKAWTQSLEFFAFTKSPQFRPPAADPSIIPQRVWTINPHLKKFTKSSHFFRPPMTWYHKAWT